jgi:hypothetical protein
MVDHFWIVFVVVMVVAIASATWASFRHPFPYRQIGRGRLSLNEGTDGAAPPKTRAAVAREREAEIRQLLEARNARRAARGHAPADIEAELAQLLAQPSAEPADPGLVAEIRDLVVARNARRARAGKEPLDVEAEVAKSLAELTDYL